MYNLHGIEVKQIGVDGGAERDDYCGGALRIRELRALDRHLGLGVQVRSGFVEDDDRRGLQQEPGQGDALLFPASCTWTTQPP